MKSTRRPLSRLLAVACALLLAVHSPTTANGADDGDAFANLAAMAENGDPEAQFNLARLYLTGGAMAEPDSEKAVHWMKKAAEQDFAPAQTMIGLFYQSGELFEPDDAQAKLWFKKGAENGNPLGQYLYGLVILNEGLPRNEDNDAKVVIGMDWIRMAARQGVPQAVEAVETWDNAAKRERENMPPERIEMFKKWTEEAEQGDSEAMYKLGYAHYDINSGVFDMDKAWEVLEKAAESGNAGAQDMLGYLYTNIPSRKDMEKAVYWMEKAARQDSLRSLNVMAGIYTLGDYAEQDLVKGRDYYFRALDLGYSEAAAGINALYEYSGSGPYEDPEKQREWFRDGAERGVPAAQLKLGLGYALENDFENGVKWLGKAADQGNATAQYFLATLYVDGKGVDRDLDKARKLFEKARAGGYDVPSEVFSQLDAPGNGEKPVNADKNIEQKVMKQ